MRTPTHLDASVELTLSSVTFEMGSLVSLQVHARRLKPGDEPVTAMTGYSNEAREEGATLSAAGF